MSEQLLLTLTLALPAGGSVLIALAGERFRNIREAISLVTSIMLCLVVINLYQALPSTDSAVLTLASVMPGLSLAFNLEPLGLMFALIASFLWIITTIYFV